MNPLLSLVYVSTAVNLFSHVELERLLSSARNRNRERGITGALLYSDGNFMQYLEGLPSNVEEIYQLIKRDKNHRGVIEVIRKEITVREFGNWSMAYWSPEVQCHDGGIDVQILNPEISFNQPSQSIPRSLLHGFWSRVNLNKIN